MQESSGDAEQIDRFHARLRMISEATRAFAEATTDYERLLDSVAHTLSDIIEDTCAVFLLEEDGASLRTVSLHATDPVALEQIRKTYAEPLRLREQPALRRVLDTGQALLVPRLDATAPRSDTTPRHVAGQRELGLHSFLVVAMRSHGEHIGVLALGRHRPQSPAFNEQDVELAQILADHASLAISNARLYQVARAAREAAELAEERARRSEQTHRFLFESFPLAAFVFDVGSSRVLAANPAAVALYGYSMQEFLTLSLNDLRAPDEHARLESALRAAGDAHMTGSGRHRRKDGTMMLVEGHNYVTTFEGRKVRFAVVQDHTERLQAEAAQRDSENRLRRTLDMMMEGYTILDHELRYVYVNEVGARQARFTKEQLVGKTPMELLPDFESTGMYALLRRCASERVAVQMEEELTHVDGSKAYFEVNVQPTAEGLVILSIDTTDRRRTALAREALEEQLRQSQRMDAVGRLAGGVAHDFNNILSIILGYGETLLCDLPAEMPQRADVVEIHKAAQRAAELTKQLLMFSRQQMLEPKVLDLNEVLAGMQKMLQRILGEQLELSVMHGKDLGRVRADRGNIEQVIMNLAVNARDAMPKGGKLTIETSNIQLDEAFARTHLGTEPGPYVLLAVTDTGLGMEKATRLRVFEPFFTTKARGKGTGLGLSTVFGIVQQSRGGVWVYSEPGRGTTFKVYLPRTEGSAHVPLRSLSPLPGRGSETVLLVEDEQAVRAVAQRMLERHGYHVIVADGATEALSLCEARDVRVDLLLTDVVMPRMSGADLASCLSTKWPALKVLYMSGYTDGSVVAHGVLEGGVPFLQKPFTSDQLALKLRSVLDASAAEA